jgi:RNA polymerase primary sigma factor
MFDDDEQKPQATHITGATFDSVTDYKRHIAKYPRGLAEDLEVKLVTTLAEGVEAHNELLRGESNLSPEDIYKLKRLHRMGEKARTELIEAHLVLVFNMAKGFTGQGMAFLDLIQEGNLALIKAVEKFQLDMETRLSNYAQWVIRQRLLRALDNFGHTIRVPTKVLENRRKIDSAIQKLHLRASKEITYEDVAKETGLSLKAVIEALEIPDDPISFATPIGVDGEELQDLLAEQAEETGPENYSSVLVDALRAQLERSMEALSPNEVAVIVARFGLDGGELKTLDQIGEELDLTRERVRQIEAKAMARLRHPSRTHALRIFKDE